MTSPHSPHRPPFSKARKAVFWGFTLLFPFLFVGLLEWSLRGLGVGRSYPLFIQSQSTPDWLQANPQVIQRFYSDSVPAPEVGIATVFFARQKTPGTFRIFIQGESSAAGFPFGRGASLAGMLGQRLQRTFPEHSLEVISTAASGISSYVMLDFAEEILAQAPDAIVIYAGHNEYLGMLGVGSALAPTQSRWLTLSKLALKEFRLFQVFQQVLTREPLEKKAPSSSAAEQTTLMARIAGEKQIPEGSPLYQAGLEQFQANLEALLKKYQRAGVPVLIGTLASNEGDQPPFLNVLDSTTDKTRWHNQVQEIEKAFQSHDLLRARELVEDLLKLDRKSATAHYWEARVLEAQGENGAARQAYWRAKDLDALRFRAPEAFNDIIRQVAAQTGAIVVETQTALAQRASGQIIGEELMLEHLHPNLRGYFILADAFYEAMRQRHWIGAWNQAPSAAQAWQEVPLTEVEALVGGYKIQRLKADWPFHNELQAWTLPPPSTKLEELAQALYLKKISWLKAIQSTIPYYQAQGNWQELMKVALILADQLPQIAHAQTMAAQVLEREGRTHEASRYRQRAQHASQWANLPAPGTP